MISYDNYENPKIFQDQYEIQSDSNSKDELTLITGNNLTERAQSLIDDDVGSNTNLDFIPVRDGCSKNKQFKSPDQIEIIDVPIKIQSYEDKSQIYKCEDSNDRKNLNYKRNNPNRDVDEYDLEGNHYGFADSNRYCNELLQTVRHIVQPSITLTKHENRHLDEPYQHRQYQPVYNQMNESSSPSCYSPVTTDIGRQITQLARRIESLGNISRVCQDDIENYSVIPKYDNYCSTDNITVIPHHELHISDNYSVKAARKLDEIGRLQKKQEAMQNRLVDLAKRLNDSTRDLTRIPSKPILNEEPVTESDYFHGKVAKPSKKSSKKLGQKNRKSTTKSHQSSFLKNILNDANEGKATELPLLSSSYCLHNDLSMGTAESGISESTSKYLSDELANIRQEFRTQVEEIRKLLSERYQQSIEQPKKPEITQQPYESLSDQIAKSVQKLSRDNSPSLKNITNINNNYNSECPLDKYLIKSNKTEDLPSLHSDIVPSLRPGILPSVARAIKSKQRMLSDPVEAEKFLIELANRRSNLENNLRCLERTKEKEFLFSILERLQGDENNVDLARIQAMVDDAIASINPVVKFEVKQEYLLWIERRKEQREQQLIAEEEEKQFINKLKSTKQTKVQRPVHYHTLPSASAITGRPWICKKYLSVHSKVDSGVKKQPEIPISRAARSQSPSRPTNHIPSASTHATWSNRRRYRSPYLHFINDVKLAKKSINPLGNGARKIPIITNMETKSVKHRSRTSPQRQNDDLILMSVKQYSLDYKEDEEQIVPIEKPQLVTKSTSPRTISIPELTSPISSNSYDNKHDTNQSNKNWAIQTQNQSHYSEPTPPSPTLSEKGTGFQLKSKPSLKPREERVGPYTPIDPTETTKLVSHPVHVMLTKPQPAAEPDINGLRLLIERALLDQIQIPSARTSYDETETVTRVQNVATPLPTDVDGYSSHISPEYSTKENYDRTLSYVDNIKTPDTSQVISEHSFRPTRVSTPSHSLNTSHKSSPIKSPKHQMVSEAIQTICDNAAQTEEDKEIQTVPVQSGTQTPKTPRKPPSDTSAGSITTIFDESQSDTQAHSFSDGMWLYDRSEGEMAPYQIETVSRWKLGNCPENPLWYNGTDDIINVDRQSIGSFGEFTKPTLPGLIPTLDPVLQLKTLPFKPPYETPDINKDDDFMYMSHRQQSFPTNFKSLGVSRDSKSKFTTPRNYQTSSANFNGSEGEINDQEDDNDYISEEEDKEPDNFNYRSSEDFRPESPFLMNIRQSKESGRSEIVDPPRDSLSDRMQVDFNKYLRASKQSHSDMSDNDHLMSTNQIVENAFRGGDSADFEGFSDYTNDRHIGDYPNANKQTVKIPTLGTVEQSNPSISDDNLEIINI